MKTLMLVVGCLGLLTGLLWMGQGLGFVRWPEASFMVDVRPWAVRGALLAAASAALILWSRRR